MSSENPGLRLCKVCLKWKPATREYFYRQHGRWLRTECKVCNLAGRNSTDRKSRRLPVIDGKRQCPDCGRWFELSPDNFPRNGSRLKTRCKRCHAVYHRNYMRRLRASEND